MRTTRTTSLWPRLAVVASAATLAVAAAVPTVPSAGAASVSSMRAEIDRTQSKINGKQAHAQVIASTISKLSGRINGIQGGITKLRTRESGVQARLDSAIARLRVIQAEHQAAEKRLAQLQERLVFSRRTLARRLLDLYQSDRPDLITVVLHSDGFARLIENREYLSRIGGQDRQIISTVKQDKNETAKLSARLASTEAARQAVAAQIQANRDEISSVRGALESKQQAWIDARSARRSALADVRRQSRHLKDHKDALQADIDAVTGQLRSSTPLPAGPIRSGAGRFIWPVNGTITSPFCESRSWESCHPGIDLGVPTGTPIRAAGAGVVQIAGPNGGYGNYTCVGHGGGVSTCYAHQSQINVSVGQSVSQGQVIGLSGNTGHSTGPHLHFEVRVNGSVTNPLNWL